MSWSAGYFKVSSNQLHFSSFPKVCFSSDGHTEIYGIKGHSIRLDIPAQRNDSELVWKLQDGTIIVKDKTVAPRYQQKVFFDKDFSIQLTNLSENDNGIYIAINLEGKWKETTLVSYELVLMGK